MASHEARNQSGKNQHLPPPPEEIIRPHIEMYFSIGRSDVEIVDLLKAHYDTDLYGFSVASLKRRRKEWGLLSTRQQKHTLDSIAGPVAEIRKRFPNRGQDGMKKALLIEYKMKVPRPLIGEHLLATEPEKVKQRLARRFKRKRYYAAGVNDVWAQDQHDKWGPQYGLWLHTSLDPHPGWINWMKVWWTNSNPRLITKYYLDSCRDMSGVPLTTQSDPGTENNGVANVHTLIRHTLDPSLRDTRQHRFMRKHNNVKPESVWSLLRRDFTPGFQNIFDEGINHGLYDVNDPLEKLVFRWLAIPWIQAELDTWVYQRNFTAPRHDKNKILPQGVPAIIRAYPKKYNALDYKIGVPDSLFDEMEAKYAPPDHEVFQLTPFPFDSRANKYYEQMGRPPVSSDSFWNVYQQLLVRFQGAEPSDDLTEVLSDLENHTERIAKEKVDVHPGLKPLRLGATVVGDGIDRTGNDSGMEVAMTESEEDEAGPSVPCASDSESAAPTFQASMTPSESLIGPTRTIPSSRHGSTHCTQARTRNHCTRGLDTV